MLDLVKIRERAMFPVPAYEDGGAAAPDHHPQAIIVELGEE